MLNLNQEETKSQNYEQNQYEEEEYQINSCGYDYQNQQPIDTSLARQCQEELEQFGSSMPQNQYGDLYKMIVSLKGEEEGAKYLQKQFQNNIEEQMSEQFIRQIQEEDNQRFMSNQKHESDTMDETLALIEKMQQEEEELQRLHQEKVQEALKNAEDEILTCKICYCEIDDSEPLSSMENCIHTFHQECIKRFFEIGLQENKLPYVCPIDTCRVQVNPLNVESVLSEENVKKYQERSVGKYVDQNQDVSWCPTPGCQYSFFFEQGDHEFKCKLCEKKYCLDCRVNWHEGMNCEAYKTSLRAKEINDNVQKEDHQFMEFVRGNKLKQCGRCKMFVEKASGCNWMKCNCGFEFCYHCGFDHKENHQTGKSNECPAYQQTHFLFTKKRKPLYEAPAKKEGAQAGKAKFLKKGEAAAGRGGAKIPARGGARK